MGILLELKLDWTYKVQKHRANAFLFMVEVNIGLKIIFKMFYGPFGLRRKEGSRVE